MLHVGNRALIYIIFNFSKGGIPVASGSAGNPYMGKIFAPAGPPLPPGLAMSAPTGQPITSSPILKQR